MVEKYTIRRSCDGAKNGLNDHEVSGVVLEEEYDERRLRLQLPIERERGEDDGKTGGTYLH